MIIKGNMAEQMIALRSAPSIAHSSDTTMLLSEDGIRDVTACINIPSVILAFVL